MATAKKTGETRTRAEAREATDATKAMNQETFADRQSRDTTEAGNVVQGTTEPNTVDIRQAEQEDPQERINREVAEQQGKDGSTASKEPGPKYKQ